jgi:hypothetical protein
MLDVKTKWRILPLGLRIFLVTGDEERQMKKSAIYPLHMDDVILQDILCLISETLHPNPALAESRGEVEFCAQHSLRFMTLCGLFLQQAINPADAS